MKSFRYNII